MRHCPLASALQIMAPSGCARGAVPQQNCPKACQGMSWISCTRTMIKELDGHGL
jgi:hypothetical protein